jgi:hypothetical protein
VRQRCLDLPLRSVGEIRRVAPVYNPVTLSLFQSEGHKLPEAIAERFKAAEEDPITRDLCLAFAPMLIAQIPRPLLRRYYAPAMKLIDEQPLWNKEELPEQIGEPGPWGFATFTVSRAGVELEFASLLLRYGYALILDPGEGSESVNLALSTYAPAPGSRSRKQPLWYGQSFTKTQYARDFIQVHETVCRVIDIVQEEGLLHKASDNCGYFATRSWKDAGKRVNEELTFAQAVGGLFGLAVGNLREEGADIQVVVDNASKAKPVDFSAALKREQEAEPEP